MLEVGQYTNEELIQMHRDGVEFAADVLWEQNVGVVNILIDKRKTTSRLFYEELLSLMHLAFSQTINEYNYDKGYKFTTLLKKIFFNRASHAIESNNRKKRTWEKFVSMQDRPYPDSKYLVEEVVGVESDLSSVEILPKDIKEAFDYAKQFINEEYRDYIEFFILNPDCRNPEKIAEIIEQRTGIKKKRARIVEVYREARKDIVRYLVYKENQRIVKVMRNTAEEIELLKTI